MKKILVFGASNSTHSINRQLAIYASALLEGCEINLIDMNDYDMPIFGVDRERKEGFPGPALQFKELIGASDGVLISFAEHNASYSAVFKNLMDWASRLEGTLWQDKQLFFMATSPGARGGKSVLEAAVSRAKFMGGHVVAQFSLPSFKENFSSEKGILDSELKQQLLDQLALFRAAL